MCCGECGGGAGGAGLETPPSTDTPFFAPSLPPRGAARYDFTHEILPDEASFFGDCRVPRGRRVALIFRNAPHGELRHHTHTPPPRDPPNNPLTLFSPRPDTTPEPLGDSPAFTAGAEAEPPPNKH